MRPWDIPEVSGNGAALGSVLTILVGMKNFHYLSVVNMQPSSVLTWCQYRRTASLKVRMFRQNMHIDFFPFLLTVDNQGRQRIFFSSKERNGSYCRRKNYMVRKYLFYLLLWHEYICTLHILIKLYFLVSCLSSFPKSTHKKRQWNRVLPH